jgi:hypothetical protein
MGMNLGLSDPKEKIGTLKITQLLKGWKGGCDEWKYGPIM